MDAAVGLIENRVLSAARRFNELGGASGKEIAVIEPLDARPRRFSTSELKQQSSKLLNEPQGNKGEE